MNSIIGNEKAFIAGLLAAIGGSIPDVKTGCEMIEMALERLRSIVTPSL